MIIAVDFDDTIAQGEPLSLRKGADTTLKALAKHHTLILHSVRLSNPMGLALVELGDSDRADFSDYYKEFDEMREFLTTHGLWMRKENGVFDHIWIYPGKPAADIYIDDKAQKPRWDKLLETYGN